MSLFGENDSLCLSNFLQTHIFWKFDHISRTYNQINYRSIWFAKVIVILIMKTQVLFSMFFPKKTRTLTPLRFFYFHIFSNCLWICLLFKSLKIVLSYLIKSNCCIYSYFPNDSCFIFFCWWLLRVKTNGIFKTDLLSFQNRC